MPPSDGKVDSEENYFSIFLRLAIICLLAILIATLTKSAHLAGSGNQLQNMLATYRFSLLSSLIYSCIITLLIVVIPYRKAAILCRAFYVSIAMVLVNYLVLPATMGSFSVISWFCFGMEHFIGACIFSVCCVASIREFASPVCSFAILFGSYNLGCLVGCFLSRLDLLTKVFDSQFFLIIGVALVFLLHAILPQNRFEQLFRTVACSEEDELLAKHNRIELLSESFKLSEREKDVFKRLISGYTIAMISEELYISESTVKTHISKIYSKFNVASKRDLLIKVKTLNDEHVGADKTSD